MSSNADAPTGDAFRRPIALAALLVVAVLLAYLPAFRAGYIIDDANYVTENRLLDDADGLRRIWFEIESSPQYYPLVYTSFWIEQRLWRDHAAGYHAVNILLHALNAVLLWLLLWRLAWPGAWIAALLFALHPIQVETVAWVAERKNVLSAAFFLSSLLAYVRFAELDAAPSRSPRRTAYLLSLALYVAALLSKTATVALPVVALLVVWVQRGRLRRTDFAAAVPFVLVGMGMGLLTVWLETHHVQAKGELWALTFPQRIEIAGRAVWFYLGKLLWPGGLSFNYPRWSASGGLAGLLPAIGVLLALAVTWQMRARWGRGPFAALLAFLALVFPVLGFFNVFFYRYAYVADHFLYLASMAVITGLVCGMASWIQDRGSGLRKAAVATVAIAAVLLGAGTHARARVFVDLETLCRDTIEKNPKSWLAHNNLGNLHLQRGEFEPAVAELETAHEIAPDYIETHLNLAIAFMNLSRFDDAMQHAREAIRLDPQNMLGYHHLAETHLRRGRPEDAVAEYRRALQIDPAYAKSRVGLATALFQLGRIEEGIAELEPVVRQDPTNVTARANLGIALAMEGRYREALGHLEEAYRLEPDNAAVRKNLQLARERAPATAP